MLSAIEKGVSNVQLWRLSVPDGEVQKITNELQSYSATSLSLTANSNDLLTVKAERTTNLYVMPLTSTTQIQPINVKDNKIAGAGGVAWTPNGQIVYVSNASGLSNLWMMNKDGSQPKRLTDAPVNDSSPTISADGRTIAYASFRTGTLNIWQMDIDGGNPRQLTYGEADRAPGYTPDGKWILYNSLAANGFVAWKLPLTGGKPVKLIDGTSLYPIASPDGKLIACMMPRGQRGEQNALAIISTENGQTIQTLNFTPALGGRKMVWSPDSRAIFYVNVRQGSANIWRLPLDGSPAKPVTDFKNEQIWSFDVSRDGKQFVIARGTINSDVVLISEVK